MPQLTEAQRQFIEQFIIALPTGSDRVEPAPAPGGFQIFIKGSGGKTATLDVTAGMSSQQVFKAYCKKMGMPDDVDAYLSHASRPFYGDQTLLDANIGRDATLQFNVRGRGGGGKKDDSDKGSGAKASKPATIGPAPLDHKKQETVDKVVKEHGGNKGLQKDARLRLEASSQRKGGAITEGEAKWKMTEPDMREALLKQKGVNKKNVDEYLQGMGFGKGITAVRVPPRDGMPMVRGHAIDAFYTPFENEIQERVRKKMQAEGGHDNEEIQTAIKKEIDELHRDQRRRGEANKVGEAAFQEARRDKEHVTKMFEDLDPKDFKSFLKELDTKLERNPNMLTSLKICERKQPPLPANAGYQQNCETDTLDIKNPVINLFFKGIVGDAAFRPSGTHGNAEKKLPTKKDPFSAAPDLDLYVELGVGGGGGLRIVQNLETGQIYLSAHYRHFYLIEDNGEIPKIATERLADGRHFALYQYYAELYRFCDFKVKVPTRDAEAAKGEFAKTALSALKQAYKMLSAQNKKRESAKGEAQAKEQKAFDKLKEQMVAAYAHSVAPVVRSKLFLLAAEDKDNVDALLKWVRMFEDKMSEAVDQALIRYARDTELGVEIGESFPSYQKFYEANPEDVEKDYTGSALTAKQNEWKPQDAEWDAVPPDGNCLFHCLVKAGVGDSHGALRQELADAVRSDPIFNGFIPDRGEAADVIARNGTYTGEAAFTTEYIARLKPIKLTVVEENGSVHTIGNGAKRIVLARASSHYWILKQANGAYFT